MFKRLFWWTNYLKMNTVYIFVSAALNKDFITIISATSELPPSKYMKCRDTSDPSKPCTCQIHTCIGWYPCGLKYCRGTDSSGKEVNYRCGIKTCKKCVGFIYVANPKLKCLWDFWSSSSPSPVMQIFLGIMLLLCVVHGAYNQIR